MNISRLVEIARSVLSLESKSNIQKKLQRLSAALQELINQPQHAPHQANTVTALSDLVRANVDMSEALTPTELEFLDSINASALFTSELSHDIERRFAQNSITPAVLKTEVDRVSGERNKILETLRGVTSGLDALGLSEGKLAPGDVELGFTFPRELFENTLKGLSSEFKFLDRVISDFTEAVEGHKESAVLGELSTTDPLITIPIAVQVAIAIGGTITWMLNTYKQTLEIRQLREKSKSMGLSEELLKEFDKRITTLLDEAIDQRVLQVVESHGDVARSKEVANALRLDIRGLAIRMEHGMRVDVRYLDPPADEGEQNAQAEAFQTLAQIQKKLKFDEITAEPFLQLERPEVDQDGEGGSVKGSSVTRKNRDVKK